MPTLPEQQTIVQYIANSAQFQYTFAFYAPLPSDIQVFLQSPSAQPIPSADILVLGVDYTVTYNPNPITGGYITLIVAPTTGWYLTINRNVQASITTNFALVQNINGADLDAAFDRCILLCQQNQNYALQRNLSYIINTYLPNAVPYTQLPPLAQNYIWVGSGSGVVAAQLAVSPSASVLQSLLANNAPGTDGARLIGYYDAQTSTPTTVQAFLSNLDHVANPNVVIGGNMTTNPFQRGTTFSNITAGYIADRFLFASAGGGTVTSSLPADAPSVALSGVFGTRSLGVSVVTPDNVMAATSAYGINYVIEGYDWTYLAQNPFTVSFYVKSSVPGNYCVAFQNAGQDQSYIYQYTIVSAGVWQKIVVTVPASPSAGTWNYTNGAGLAVFFCLGAGSNLQGAPNTWLAANKLSTAGQTNLMASNGNTFQFDKLKIETGINATAWLERSQADELKLCQRYFNKSYSQGTNPGTATTLGNLIFISAAAYPGGTPIISQTLPATMRTTPTVTIYSPGTGAPNNLYDIFAAADIAASATYLGNSTYTVAPGAALGVSHINSWHYTANADF